jgi:hypothetical protein
MQGSSKTLHVLSNEEHQSEASIVGDLVVSSCVHRTPENTTCGREHHLWQRTPPVAENTTCGREQVLLFIKLHYRG